MRRHASRACSLLLLLASSAASEDRQVVDVFVSGTEGYHTFGVLYEKDDYRTISLVTFTLAWLEE
jgi:hypothetical protein